MLPLILHGIGVQLAFPTLTLLLLDRFPHHRGGISSVQAFASLLLCSFVAGVMSPLLSASMLHLALGASGLTLAGVVGWWRYHRVTRQPLDQPLAGAGTAAMQAEIAEPR
jgi:DHA1 family bicyclomycin/chloramphenicol resistance-like MFS transporter